MSEIKLICSDVDGTLIGRSGLVSERDKSALRRAVVGKGLRFALVTGRFRGGIGCITSQLDFPVAVSCFNGLYVECDGAVLHDRPTDKALLLGVLPLIRRFGCVPMVFSIDGWAMEDRSVWWDRQVAFCGFEGTLENLENVLSPSWPESYYKILAKHEDTSVLERLRDAFLAGSYPGMAVVFSSPNILEFVPAYADKGETVGVLTKKMGIKPENVIAFGDWDNDIGLLRSAGIGVCMANGTPAARAAADYVTLSNEEGGIAHALERFVFQEG